MEYQSKQWHNQALYAGIDLHKNKWVVSVRTPEVLLKTFVTEPSKQALLKTFQNNWPGAKINAAYEAGCFGYHLAEFLNRNNISTQIIAPQNIPTAPGNFTKTDKIDSKKIAFELCKGTISGIYIRQETELFHRHLIRKRKQLDKRRQQLQVQIRSDLTFYGIDLEFPLNKYWSKKTIKNLRQMNLPHPFFQSVLVMYLTEYEWLKEQLKTMNKMLKALINSNEYRERVTLLRTVPGIGDLAAITILLEIGDFSRFANTEKFASYLGLTPSEYSSGEKIRKGSLTGMGNSNLRRLFIEISWWAIKKDPVLLEKFERIAKGKSRCKAIVAIAKTMANRIRKVMLTNEEYVIGVVR